MFQALLGPISELAGSFMQGQIEKQKQKLHWRKLKQRQRLRL